ncbi:unnamed protein product [Closterium sp. NIES-65]|nr:unnamed protein product [Closterium sp. NIES-65]
MWAARRGSLLAGGTWWGKRSKGSRRINKWAGQGVRGGQARGVVGKQGTWWASKGRGGQARGVVGKQGAWWASKGRGGQARGVVGKQGAWWASKGRGGQARGVVGKQGRVAARGVVGKQGAWWASKGRGGQARGVVGKQGAWWASKGRGGQARGVVNIDAADVDGQERKLYAGGTWWVEGRNGEWVGGTIRLCCPHDLLPCQPSHALVISYVLCLSASCVIEQD